MRQSFRKSETISKKPLNGKCVCMHLYMNASYCAVMLFVFNDIYLQVAGLCAQSNMHTAWPSLAGRHARPHNTKSKRRLIFLFFLIFLFSSLCEHKDYKKIKKATQETAKKNRNKFTCWPQQVHYLPVGGIDQAIDEALRKNITM